MSFSLRLSHQGGAVDVAVVGRIGNLNASYLASDPPLAGGSAHSGCKYTLADEAERRFVGAWSSSFSGGAEQTAVLLLWSTREVRCGNLLHVPP